jgi:two-component system, NarL family, nitrate/nitrite response regulator NarL
MGTGVATIIIEPRLLVRQALESLMAHHSYRVVYGAGSTADIGGASSVHEGPNLAILSAQSADNAVNEAVAIRKLWPDSKIILLFERASPLDFQKLLASQVDGCVPLSVSPETLIGTLDLIMTKDVRVMVVADAKRPAQTLPGTEHSEGAEMPTDKLQSNGSQPQGAPATLLSLQHSAPNGSGADAAEADARHGETPLAPTPRGLPKLSEREGQILDGLVKGHANKVIARTCDITEATVKVHMKSILRKIQVANRTQAAIWALEHGYPADEIKSRVLKAPATPNAASIM